MSDWLVTFSNYSSFMQAAKTAFVTIRTAELTNKMQVEPYQEGAPRRVSFYLKLKMSSEKRHNYFILFHRNEA